MPVSDRESVKQSERFQELKSSEIAQIFNSVQSLLAQNQSKLESIVKADVKYSYELYEPVQHTGVVKAIHKQLLLKQLDRLLEDQAVLNIKLRNLEYHSRETDDEKNRMLDASANHYTTLRTAWNQLSCNHHTNVAERVESLNQVVGMIKKNILNLTAREKRSEETYQESKTAQSICPAKAQEINEKLMMQNQDFRSQIIKLSTEKAAVEQKNAKLEKDLAELNQANKVEKRKNMCTMIDTKSIIAKLNAEKFQLEEKLKEHSKNAQSFIKSFQNSEEGFEVQLLKEKSMLKSNSTTKTLEQIIEFISVDTNSPQAQITNSKLSEALKPQQNQIPERSRKTAYNERAKSARKPKRVIKGFDYEQLELQTKKYMRKNTNADKIGLISEFKIEI